MRMRRSAVTGWAYGLVPAASVAYSCAPSQGRYSRSAACDTDASTSARAARTAASSEAGETVPAGAASDRWNENSRSETMRPFTGSAGCVAQSANTATSRPDSLAISQTALARRSSEVIGSRAPVCGLKRVKSRIRCSSGCGRWPSWSTRVARAAGPASGARPSGPRARAGRDAASPPRRGTRREAASRRHRARPRSRSAPGRPGARAAGRGLPRRPRLPRPRSRARRGRVSATSSSVGHVITLPL